MSWEPEHKPQQQAIKQKPETTTEELQQNKHHRQELKIQCLHHAISFNGNRDNKADKIVEAAKAFYAFVRT